MELLSYVLHIDQHLITFVQNYGVWLYALLFAIVFAETGLVVAPILPGDSLLFAAGMLSATGAIQIEWVLPILFIAAVMGDNFNAAVGRHVGLRLINKPNRWIKRDHLKHAEHFFQKYGPIAIVAARFMPFVRTFVPFVAGISQMPAKTYALYSVIGAFIWVNSFVWLGYLLGQIPFFKNHISTIGLAILGFSVLPMVVAAVMQQRNKRKAAVLAQSELAQTLPKTVVAEPVITNTIKSPQDTV